MESDQHDFAQSKSWAFERLSAYRLLRLSDSQNKDTFKLCVGATTYNRILVERLQLNDLLGGDRQLLFKVPAFVTTTSVTLNRRRVGYIAPTLTLQQRYWIELSNAIIGESLRHRGIDVLNEMKVSAMDRFRSSLRQSGLGHFLKDYESG